MAWRGARGAVRWYHYTAADIASYCVTPIPDRRDVYALEGDAVRRDAFKLTQRPLVFVVRVGTSEMIWPIVSFAIADSGRFSARLGPPMTTPTEAA